MIPDKIYHLKVVKTLQNNQILTLECDILDYPRNDIFLRYPVCPQWGRWFSDLVVIFGVDVAEALERGVDLAMLATLCVNREFWGDFQNGLLVRIFSSNGESPGSHQPNQYQPNTNLRAPSID